ncbi:MAG: RluA family pseudouridine synthase [Polyangiaceae bacterium]
MSDQRFVVEASHSGERLDKFVIAVVPGLGRKGARRLFDEGRVRINGKRPRKGDLARQGDQVVIALPDSAGPNAVPESSSTLLVRLETAQAVVVEKPPGQPTAPVDDGETGTLANALVGHYPEMENVGYSPREPGLVHRLDTDTSGLVLAARSEAAFDTLSKGLKAGAIEKRYLLICHGAGLASSGEIGIPIAHHPKDQKRMYPCVHPRDVARYRPRPATTTFRVLRMTGEWALVEARAASAIRHQLRVHFASIGHPLAGDGLYGGPVAAGLTRHALHASYVGWRGDAVVPALEAHSPLPADLVAAFAAFAEFGDERPAGR